jgi:hypothetical protein
MEHFTILCLSRPIEAEVLEYLNEDGRTELRTKKGCWKNAGRKQILLVKDVTV